MAFDRVQQKDENIEDRRNKQKLSRDIQSLSEDIDDINDDIGNLPSLDDIIADFAARVITHESDTMGDPLEPSIGALIVIDNDGDLVYSGN